MAVVAGAVRVGEVTIPVTATITLPLAPAPAKKTPDHRR